MEYAGKWLFAGRSLSSQTLKRHVVKIKTLCHASESGHPNFYSVFTVFSGCHLAALRALAGMTAAFIVFYLQDFKTDVFKTLQILTFKNLSLCLFYSIK
jgi:hypothetical protein